MRTLRQVFSAGLISSFLLLAVGFASDNGVDKAVHSIAATRIEVVKAQNDLYETMGSLDALQNATGDLRPAYQRFKTDLETTTAQAKRAEQLAVSMRRQLRCLSEAMGRGSFRD